MAYTYLVRDPHRLVQYLANNLLKHGYWFYVAMWLPEHKDPVLVDAKLSLLYETFHPKEKVGRRRKAGHAAVKYVRCDRLCLLIATRGRSPFFEREAFQDIRQAPLHVAGYSVGVNRESEKVSVRLHRECQRRLKREFTERAAWDLRWWQRFLRSFPWLSFGGVQDNAHALVRHLNDCRKALRLPPVDFAEHFPRTFTPAPVFLPSPPELLELLRHETGRK